MYSMTKAALAGDTSNPLESRRHSCLTRYHRQGCANACCRLAASATPKSPADVAALKDAGIKHVYTLTEEEPLPANFFSLQGPQHTFSPVSDGRAPSFTQVTIVILACFHECTVLI